jgi:NADPH-dependent 2,4-dienoyl-CoA reductase/sulfur reductase-like enzyme
VAQLVEEAGAAFVDISAGIFEAPAAVMDPMYYPQGWNTYAAAEVKRHVKIPVITSHTLRDPDYCERILAESQADLVGLSRQMIADPYWANKAFARKPAEIRKCISCLVGCWQESLMIKRHMRCAINPAVGDERFVHIAPAPVPRRLAVVGGGPAGLEAARIARLRGHRVTLFEKTGELGGAILHCCSAPGKQKMRWYADWLRHQTHKLGTEVCLNAALRVEDLTGFDAVVLATGSIVARPDIPGIDLPLVGTYEDILRCDMEHCEFFPGNKPRSLETGEHVVVWGDHFAAVDAAEKLAVEGKRVTVVTESNEFAAWMEPCHRDVMLKRFAGRNGEGLPERPFANPVTVISRTTVSQIGSDGTVVLLNDQFQKSQLQVQNVVLANVLPDRSLYDSLLEAGVAVTQIGDARQVRNLRAAVTEGANAGLTIDQDLALNANRALISQLPTEVAR